MTIRSKTPQHALEREALLAAYATYGSKSRGRLVAEPECPMRSPYQRDRDRIVHATAFRRLTHKTQVFLYHEGDHYRTRLTHTLEVAQIARALARLLWLDEDLAEAVALAHDLGHPPFGHAGERALDEAMADFGGFDHNAQSLKVVTALEHKYARFDGLNLTWETLEGLVKHNGPMPVADSVPQPIADFDTKFNLDLALFASAEAQVAAIADDIAYNNHDIDDGLRAGLISLEELREVPLAARFIDEIASCHPQLEGQKIIYEVNRRMITSMIEDAAGEARRRLSVCAPKSNTQIARADAPMIAFSDTLTAELSELRGFLFDHVYRHDKVMRVMTNAQGIVRQLFAHYMKTPKSLPPNWQQELARAGDGKGGDDKAMAPLGRGAAGGDAGKAASGKAGVICDFVAGMTDRYAIDAHNGLFDVTPELR